MSVLLNLFLHGGLVMSSSDGCCILSKSYDLRQFADYQHIACAITQPSKLFEVFNVLEMFVEKEEYFLQSFVLCLHTQRMYCFPQGSCCLDVQIKMHILNVKLCTQKMSYRNQMAVK